MRAENNDEVDRASAGGEFPEEFLDYRFRMVKVKARIDECHLLLGQYSDERGLLYAAAQLRLAIEEIAMATLVGNKRWVETVSKRIQEGDWNEVRRELRRINPKFWPRAVAQERSGDLTRWIPVQGTLEEAEVGRVWSRISALLHARNPFLKELNLAEEKRFLLKTCGKVARLLSEHIVEMPCGEMILCCQVWADPVQVYAFTPAE